MLHKQYYIYQKFKNKYRKGGIVIVSRAFEEPSNFSESSPERFTKAGAYLFNVLPSAKQIFPINSVPDYDRSGNLRALTRKEEEIVFGTIAGMRSRNKRSNNDLEQRTGQ